MPIIVPDEVVTGALVNAIAVVGRQISKAVAAGRKSDDVATARWFETFRLTGALPDQPGLSSATQDRLAEILNGDEIQAALQELLAVRLTDAPNTDAAQARDAVRVALSGTGPDAAGFAEALAGYYDDQICSLVARLEAKDPPLLAQIRSEAFSARIISALHAIERHTAALADAERRSAHGQAHAWPWAGNDPARALRMQPVGPPAGRLLAEVTDPFALEVHRAVQADDPPPDLPALPEYVPREHDGALAGVVKEAAAGSSGIAVLVGGSSTGKTRACWEVLGLLRDLPQPWRLWHPIDPSRPDAALRELPSIGPQTVIWLNEAQFYLDAPGGDLGERVAAGLRELLRVPARGPVLVLATLWPQFWDTLTSRPAGRADPHAQARELLAGRDISVPGAFTAAQLHNLTQAADPRLAQAAAASPDGQVIQFLAGAPELLARYRNAPPAAVSLINAAIDARRLGMGIALPLAFLEAAAPGYLTDAEWDGLDEDWLEQSLAYTAAPCKGTRGPLTRIRLRPGRTAGTASGSAYRLADYLDQHGRRARRRHIPPAGFWAAAASFADPGNLRALARAAEARGMLLAAARLYKHATAQGDTLAAAELMERSCSLYPDDQNPARWVAAHAGFDDPSALALLLTPLQRAGAGEQVKVLVDRAAAHSILDDPDIVARLLDALPSAGAEEQIKVLVDRAAHSAPRTPHAIVQLVHALRRAGALRTAGAEEQLAELLTRYPAAYEHLTRDRGRPARKRSRPVGSVAAAALRTAAAKEQVTALLADDPAALAALDDPSAVAELLDELRRAGADEQVAALRDPLTSEGLKDRLACEGRFDLFLRLDSDPTRYRFGREDDGNPAPPWGWDDLD